MPAERTPDGHHFVVGGRRWRAQDPGIPEALASELVSELMTARRLVKTDPHAARPRVRDAKVALGERGYEWWTEPTDDRRDERIAATLRALLRHRDGGTVCPSDVARVVGGAAGRPDDDDTEAWRALMPAVRAVAAGMCDEGEVVVTQRGEEVAAEASGPVRIGFAPGRPTGSG